MKSLITVSIHFFKRQIESLDLFTTYETIGADELIAAIPIVNFPANAVTLKLYDKIEDHRFLQSPVPH